MQFPATPTPQEINNWFVNVAPPAANTFEFALVLGGTVSAGAYTAGVIDFIVEALDEWTSRRDAGDPSAPPHKTVLKTITGTSGGGVNAGVLARALAYDFPHVTRATDPTSRATQNPFYDLWINNVNLTGFLGTSDIDRKQFASLLDGDTLDSAATAGIGFTGANWRSRSWIGDPLRVILTLTNLCGIPYKTQLSGAAAGVGESFVNHADYARFAFVYPGQTPIQPRPDEFVLAFGSERFTQALDWPSFGEFAKATSAFPLGFPARALVRPTDQYRWRVAVVPGDGTPQNPSKVLPMIPDWIQFVPAGQQQVPTDYRFLVVDGGATDNEPIELARTSIAGMLGRNPRDAALANRAVMLCDPFAGSVTLGPTGTLPLSEVIWPIIQTLVEQTRYGTSDLLLAMDDDVFSRFLITPLSGVVAGEKAIASAGFGAFIGFACRDFMRYDYLLGRSNAQAYLRNSFVLDQANPVFSNWPAALKNSPDFAVTDSNGTVFLPIIPLMGNARVPETLDPWPKGKLNPESYRDLIEARFRALVEYEGSGGLLSGIATWALAHLTQKSVADLIINAMNSALVAWNLK